MADAPGYLAAYKASLTGTMFSEVESADNRLLSRRLARRPNKVALLTSTLGNSIFAGVNRISFSDQAIWRSSEVATWIKNGGVAGNTSAMIVARMATDVPAGTQICVFGEGSNDALQGVSVATHRTNIEAIIVYLLSRFITPVLIITAPNTTKSAVINGYVAAEQALAWKYGIAAFDPWRASVDVTTGDWVVGDTTDSTHPTFAAASTAATALMNFLTGVTTAQGFGPRANSAGTAGYNLSGGNCMMMTDTNADGVPDGWIIAGTATASNPSAPAGFSGKMARITGTGATGSPYLRKIITTGWQAGDELMISMAIEAHAVSTSGNYFLTVKVDGGPEINILNGGLFDITGQRINYFITPTTTTQIEIYAKVNGTLTDNYIGIGEFEVYNMTALLSR